MRKLLLGTIVLLSFCTALLIFQISCTKSSEASPPPDNEENTETVGVQQQNKIIYADGIDWWISDFDGNDKKELNISLPQNLEIGMLKIAPDGKTVIIAAFSGDYNNRNTYLYSGTLEGNDINNLTIIDERLSKDGYDDAEFWSINVF